MYNIHVYMYCEWYQITVSICLPQTNTWYPRLVWNSKWCIQENDSNPIPTNALLYLVKVFYNILTYSYLHILMQHLCNYVYSLQLIFNKLRKLILVSWCLLDLRIWCLKSRFFICGILYFSILEYKKYLNTLKIIFIKDFEI